MSTDSCALKVRDPTQERVDQYWTNAARSRLFALEEHLPCSGCGPDPNSGVCQFLVGELDSIQAVKDTFTMKYNMTTPIARLPAEVLAEIFIWSRRLDEKRVADGMWWIKLAHVCRQWRYAALNAPRLWAAGTLHQADLEFDCIREVLRRSKAVPIAIEVNCNDISNVEFDDLLLEHAFHFESLTLDDFHDENSGSWSHIMECPMPMLETLSVLGEDRFRYKSHDLPDKIFSGHLPRLRQIRLYGIRPPWQSSVLSDLRDFTLETYGVNSQQPLFPSTMHVMDCFRTLSNLTTLRLCGSIIFAPFVEAFRSSIPLQFPHLRVLHLEQSSFDSFANFLQCLDLPSSTRMVLSGMPGMGQIIPDQNLNVATHPLFPLLRKKFADKGAKRELSPIRSLEAHLHCVTASSQEPDILSKTCNLPFTENHWDVRPELQIFHCQKIVTLLRSMALSLPMHDVDSLCIWTHKPRRPDWRIRFVSDTEMSSLTDERASFFRELPNLYHLKLISNLRSVIAVLRDLGDAMNQPDGKNDTDTSDIILPHLRELSLSFIGGYKAGENVEALFRQLLVMLEKRKRAGVTIRHLLLSYETRGCPDDAMIMTIFEKYKYDVRSRVETLCFESEKEE